MTPDELARQLHDKATRGQKLEATEQAYLEAWYARQDKEEGDQLSAAPPSQALASLEAQVTGVMADLVAVTQRIQELAASNEAVRREIAALQRQLAHKQAVQPA
jgi:hypothetical protein